MKQDPTWKSYEETASKYAENVEELHPYREGERFLSLLEGDKTIIDIGCGSGRDAKIFTDKGCRVVGIDYSPNLIEIAKQKAPQATFILGDIQEMNLETTFDGAWANVSLLHIPKGNFLASLRRIRAILNEGGVFYMKLKKGFGESIETDLRYKEAPQKFFSYFQEDEIANCLEKAGMTVLDIYSECKEHAYHTHPYIHSFSKKIP